MTAALPSATASREHGRISRERLTRLLAPASVAVVGANDRAGSYAAETLHNLALLGFPGPVWGVNPRRREVLGRPCVPTVADLPEPVDAVVVAIPAAGVPEVIEHAGDRGCGGAVVLSAGFGEVESGRELHRRLVAAAARHGLPVCGPNCNGIVVPAARVALWGDALAAPEPGPVALVSQSGNVAVNALATRRGLRLHTVIASGNQAVLSAGDYLEFLAARDGVGAIALYLEDDGGPRLVQGLAACAEEGRPVVMLKVGASAAGAAAALAHSGALAGDQRVFRALARDAGAVWAHDVHELLELAKALAVRRTAGRGRARSAGGEGLAIMTCSGGDSAQGADEAQRLGLDLPGLAAPTRARLAEQLPTAATAGNPLDYTAMIWGDAPALAELVATLGSDPAVDEVLVFYDQPHGLTGAPAESWAAVREGITLGAARSPAGTIVSSTLPELLDDAAAADFHHAGVATAAGLRTGLRCARALLQDRGADPVRLRRIAEAAAGPPVVPARWLAEHEAKDLLRQAGIPVPAGRPVQDADDAVAALRELGGPVALKASAGALRHKSELGAVALSLGSEAEVRAAHGRLAAIAAAHDGTVLVERMAPGGTELLIAAHRAGLVPALIVGLGGIWTELFDDVAVIPLPAGADRIESALRGLRGAPLLGGARGTPGVDLTATAQLAERLGALLLERSLAVLECNPVLAGPPGGGAVAVDALIATGSTQEAADG